MRLIPRATLVPLLLLLLACPNQADARRNLGIKGKAAPALELSTWFNLPKGKTQVDVADYRGKVLMMFFFQSWCPGCHSRGFPTLQKVQRHFRSDSDVRFLAVQTVFEGFGTNTAGRAKKEADRYGLTIPLGHDAGRGNTGSRVMKRYRSGGTPWLVIIDKDGIVQANGFHIPATQAIALINRLRR